MRHSYICYMNSVKFTVNKAYVYDAVDETTAYIGAKTVGDEGAYERIYTTDADRALLENFWSEACCLANDLLKPYIIEVSDNSVSHSVSLGANYVVTLKMPDNINLMLENTISTSLFQYFVYSIVSKWCMLSAKQEAESYAVDADKMIKEALRCVNHRIRPQKPTSDE